jgi:hypothetical protein
LAETIRYIHFNPVKARICRRPEDWQHSDYCEWIEVRKSSRNVAGEREQVFGSAKDYFELMSIESDDQH